jgi:protein-tyrosine phosphatase
VSRWFRSYGFADVYDNLIVGAYPLDRRDVEMLGRVGIDRVLNLVEDAEYQPGEREEVCAALDEAGIAEDRLSLTDFGGLPADELETAVRTVNAALDRGERVYLHCRAGWQRSAAVAAGVVATRTGVDIDEAVARVQARKATADPLPHQREDLRRWWAGRSSSDGAPAAPAADAPAADAPDAGDAARSHVVDAGDAPRPHAHD